MFGGKYDGLRIGTAVLIKPRSQNSDTENNLAEFGAPEETGVASIGLPRWPN